MKAAIYARVSTLDQEPENQLHELRRYVTARGWSASEHVDKGVSGAKDKHPALDQLGADAKLRLRSSESCPTSENRCCPGTQALVARRRGMTLLEFAKPPADTMPSGPGGTLTGGR